MLAYILTVAAVLAPCARGHGWISDPPSRPFCETDARNQGGFNPGGGNGGGPCMHDLGGVPGPCGDPFQSMDCSVTDFANKPCAIQATYSEGQEITVTVDISANHGGMYEFAICPKATGLTEDCFVTMITETGSTEYWSMPTDLSGGVSTWNPEPYSVRMKLPPGMTCEHCTIMWTWWTSHVCTYDCDPELCGPYAGFNQPMPTGGSGSPCPTMRPSRGQTPQMFRSCSDVAITSDGSPSTVPEPVDDEFTGTGVDNEVESTPEEPDGDGDLNARLAGPTSTPTSGPCGGNGQYKCQGDQMNGRDFECDHGYVARSGDMCEPWSAEATTTDPVPVPEPMEEPQEQPSYEPPMEEPTELNQFMEQEQFMEEEVGFTEEEIEPESQPDDGNRGGDDGNRGGDDGNGGGSGGGGDCPQGMGGLGNQMCPDGTCRDNLVPVPGGASTICRKP